MSMLLMYIALSYFITPVLRLASKQLIITRERYTKSFFESLGSVDDLKLGFEDYFISRYAVGLKFTKSLLSIELYFLKFQDYLSSL